MSQVIVNAYNTGSSIKTTQWLAITNATGGAGTVPKLYKTNTATVSNQYIVANSPNSIMWIDEAGRSGEVKIEAGHPARIRLPDGAILDVKADGSYEIIDADAKITYKANRVREFNRYINASDLLEEFIDFVDGIGGIDKDRFLALPIETFIRWLVLRAAQADGEDIPDERELITQSVIALPSPQKLPTVRRNCKCCGRFVSRRRADNGILFCSAEHFARFEKSVALSDR